MEKINIIPAIDIKAGQCVRLREGKINDLTIFGDDPLQIAKRWIDEGADSLHLIDLDGAFSGDSKNFEVIAAICKNFAKNAKIQVGGGIRSLSTIVKYLNSGVQFVILGSAAVKDPDFVFRAASDFADRIIVGVDARGGLVATDGWVNQSKISALELVDSLPESVNSVIYTDISRDGMLRGINIKSSLELAMRSKIPVIASGGLSSYSEITELRSCSNIKGVIAGRSIYEGKVEFKKLLEFAKS